jgi:hypothetical protein
VEKQQLCRLGIQSKQNNSLSALGALPDFSNPFKVCSLHAGKLAAGLREVPADWRSQEGLSWANGSHCRVVREVDNLRQSHCEPNKHHSLSPPRLLAKTVLLIP